MTASPSFAPCLPDAVDRRSAVARVLFVAHAEIGVVEQGGANRGPRVEQYLRAANLAPGDPWCAAFVAWAGRQALPVGSRLAWPVPPYGGCQQLAEWAVAHHCRYLEPKVGDVAVIWHANLTPPRFGHTCFVTAVTGDGRYSTVEGNTNPDGGREGYGVFSRTRTVRPVDRFIRWSELLPA